jgi:hypothetical protein
MSSLCGACNKTVYPMEKVDFGRPYHTFCFRCKECDCKLSLKNAQQHKNELFCGQHVPKPKLTSVADDMATQHAVNAPKKVSEGLHKTQVGTGEVGSVGLDSMSNQLAVNAPKKASEGLAKTFVASDEVLAKDSSASLEQPEEQEEQDNEEEY